MKTLGLHTYDDVTAAVDHLFLEMNLHIECNSAYRTPSRPETNRTGIVIAEMKSLRDKRVVLERKRFLRNIPHYRDVYIKSSKTHAEQVMTANFTVMLNEISNGDAYYMSDNGRIRQKSTDMPNQHRYNGNNYSGMHGGARPKTYNYNQTQEHKNVSRNNDYGYTTRHGNTHDMAHHTNPAGQNVGPSRYDDSRRNDDNKRPTIDSSDYDLYSAQNHGYHNYGTYTQQYINRHSNPQPKQLPRGVDCVADGMNSKN